MPSLALNFYSPIVEAQLRSHRKTATIRLGDKSRKYQKGMIVSVLVGARFSPRQHVFDAVLDKVEVKTITELSPNEIEHDNPEIRHHDELCRFLGQLYNRDVTGDDTVTVIRFSAIQLESRLLAAADPDPVQLGRTQRRTALLAVDGERRGEGRRARRAAMEKLSAARRATVGKLSLELLEPPPCRAAVEAECAPVPEHASPLLAQPVSRLSHATTVLTREARGSLACERLSPSTRTVQWRSLV